MGRKNKGTCEARGKKKDREGAVGKTTERGGRRVERGEGRERGVWMWG